MESYGSKSNGDFEEKTRAFLSSLTVESNIEAKEGSHRSRHEGHRDSDEKYNREREHDRDLERGRDRERERLRDRERDRRERRDRSPRGRGRENERSGRGSDLRLRERDERFDDRGRRISRSRSPRRPKSRSITPIHKKKRKLQLWDVRPAGYEGMTAEEVKATGHFPLPGQITALKLAGALGGADGGFPAPFTNIPHALAGVGAQNLAVERQQRRIYVGNIPYGITEPEIAEFFNTAMIQLRLSMEFGNPVTTVSINHEKNYAFVEFRNHDEATAAMAFDGVSFRTQALKIRRPKDYVPPTGEEDSKKTSVPGVVSTNVSDSDDKIFVGGIPFYFNEEQVIELLQAFGELRSFNLVKDMVTGVSKGYAFCEYLDPSITDIACQGLNGMEVGDKKIVMQRASVGKPNVPTPSGATQSHGAPGSNSGFFSSGTTLEPSEVLVFLNMVTAEEIEDDQEYQDIIEDVKDECDAFGKVIDFKIPREKDGFKPEDVGKIFVRYTNLDDASAALRALAGRKFSDRTVLGSYYPANKYDAGEY